MSTTPRPSKTLAHRGFCHCLLTVETAKVRLSCLPVCQKLSSRWQPDDERPSTNTARTHSHRGTRVVGWHIFLKHKEKRKEKAPLWQNAVYFYTNKRCKYKIPSGKFEGGYGTGCHSQAGSIKASPDVTPLPVQFSPFHKSNDLRQIRPPVMGPDERERKSVDNLQSAFPDAGLRYNNNGRRTWRARVDLRTLFADMNYLIRKYLRLRKLRPRSVFNSLCVCVCI